MFEFDAATHCYTLDGHELPSVSKIISPLVDWSMVPADVLEYARDRGERVHKACELWDKDDLDESSVSDDIRGYLDAWIKFRAETGFTPLFVEERLHHPLHRYAGTPDVGGTMLKKRVPRFCLIDRKATAAIHCAVRVQTAGYEGLVRATSPKLADIDRHSIQLRADGTYRFSPEYRDPDDWKTFLSLLNVARFKEKHKCN